MKKISKQQAEKIQLLPKGSGRPQNPLFLALKSLQVGEYALVDNKDYEKKSPLANALSSSIKGDGIRFSVKRLADKSGYLVKRTD